MELDLHLPRPMSPESDTETTDNAPPQLQTHLSKALSLSTNNHNGASLLKACHPQNAAVSYKECLKNHAAKLGGLALDGCGEFMPSPTASPLKCAACSCHRNFHRREHLPQPPLLLWDNSSTVPNSPAGTTTTTSSPTPYYAAFPQIPFPRNSEPKRARTKFTQEQKARMMAFAERLGWRMTRGPTEDKLVDEFCGEVGVRRNVFKVWMHNNKHRKDVNGGSKIGGEEEQLVSGGPQVVVERKVFGSVSSPSSS